MKSFSVVTLLVVAFACSLVCAEIVPRFPEVNGSLQPIVVSLTQDSGVVSGTVLPCDIDYYEINSFATVGDFEYLVIEFDQTTTVGGNAAYLWVSNSNFTNLEGALATNQNIIDTLGYLPGPLNFEYECIGSCVIEINCALTNGSYYLGVGAKGTAEVSYDFQVYLRETNGTNLVNGESFVAIDVARPVDPPFDRILNYEFYYVDIPSSPFFEYEYMTVILNLANAQSTVRIMKDKLPIDSSDAGVISGNGGPNDDCVWDYCIDTTTVPGQPDYIYPISSQDRIPCSCLSTIQTVDGQNQGFGCSLVVDPCHFGPGRWFISVELPPTGSISYQLITTVQYPLVTTLVNNVTIKGAVEPEQATHYKIVVPSNQVVQGQSHFFVQVSNVRGGTVQVWVHRASSINSNIAGGPETCAPANATCTTAWACNVVVEKCYFLPGTWYVSVNILYENSGFVVDDPNRLPVTFTIRSTWVQDAPPIPLISGIPVSRAIGEALYDFYVIQVPPTVDTWLYVELFTLSNDTEVILAMLQGSLPGGNCYSRPDFYCLTGDNRGIFYNTGPPNNQEVVPTARQSCTFTIQTCELQQGPLYLSVYGQHYGYSNYGDNTYYQNPVQYTLLVNFEVALALQTGVSLTDNVIQGQYNHYYLRADFVDEGSFMAVEATNIQHGLPKTIEVYVNYNYLAGACPCYDQLYNCTGSELPSCNGNIIGPNGQVLSDPLTVTTYCEIIVPPCAFRSGVWYISVLGVNVDSVHYTTPIGYTLTATIFPPPIVKPLILSQPVSDNVSQWNLTYAYSHYKLGASPVPLNDLIFKLNYVQSSEFLPKHDNLDDTLEMYVSIDSLATAECYHYTCAANIESQSYCTIVVPHCEWVEGNWFVSVRGNYNAIFPGRFTLTAVTKTVANQLLLNGIPVSNVVSGGLYQHYFIDVQNFQGRALDFEVYTNGDQDAVSVYVNIDQRAGDAPCFRYLPEYYCYSRSWCSIQIQSCQLSQSRYYLSVYGEPNQFYDIAVEYTLTANLQPIALVLSDGDPITGYSIVGQFQHYKIVVAQVNSGQFLLFSLDNVKHGTVQAYRNVDELAGACPCYDHQQTCIADSDNLLNLPNWCELRVPSCEFVPATYYFSVYGIENKTPTNIPYLTQIGYTLEVSIVDSVIITDMPIVEGRDTNNTLEFEFIANGRYRHYQVTIDQTQFDAGYRVVVEIDNVIDGALSVYFNNDVPADENTACQVAELCSPGLGSGDSCNWQIPYCLTKPGVHYVSVEGITGRQLASYNILIWLQAPSTINENVDFTYPVPVGSTSSLFELNVTHSAENQPYGWVEFITLNDVTTTDEGDILEVFFYNIVSNIDEPTSFYVYIFPEAPAGLHGCCAGTPSEVASCEDAPCLYHLRETTSTGYASTLDMTPNYVCDVGNGIGGDNGEGNFGGQCTVTVWACDVAATGVAGPATWWVAVIPTTQPTSASNGLDGLSYSVQWRVRSTRTGDAGQVDTSVDLTSIVASQTQSQQYSLSGFQNWMSFQFSITVGDERQRLAVQTYFDSNTPNDAAMVYINAGSFASALDCNLYTCPGATFGSLDECGNVNRYVNSSCCLESETFYISVRNTDPTGAPVSFSFFITNFVIPQTELIDSHPSFDNRFNTTSNTPVPGGSTFGVIAENYDHYELAVDENDISNYRSLVINFTRSGDNSGQLELYVRKGAEAGSNDGYVIDFLNFVYLTDFCYSYEYTCSVSGDGTTTSRCTLQIPHCQLVPGNWFISVYNPDPNYSNQASALDYLLEIYFDQPVGILVLSQEFTFDEWNFDSTYNHYMISISPVDIGFTSFNVIPTYVTNWLRFTIGAITGATPTMYINYDDVAGDPFATGCSCYNYFDSCVATGGSCYVDVLPCALQTDPFKLISGNYFIGVNLDGPSNYTLSVNVLSETYQQIDFALENGDGHRAGTVNYVYQVTPSASELSNSTDFWYNIDTALELSSTDLMGSDYFIVNLTIPNSQSSPFDLQVEVWNNECERWTCSIGTTGDQTYCVIDAVDLAPCSNQDNDGIFYFHVYNPNAIEFTLFFYHNESVIQSIVDQQTITDIIFPYEYQMYFFNATNVGMGETLMVTIDTTCGDIEAWIHPDTVAGPGTLDNGNEISCSINYCASADNVNQGSNFFDGNSATCTMFLDTCVYAQLGYWITIRGVRQEFNGQIGSVNEHLYLPIKYQLNIAQTPIAFTQISPECVSYVSYNELPVTKPTQFYVDLETVTIGSQVRFGLWLPSNAVLSSSVATLTISLDDSVGYTSTCETFASCTISPGDNECYTIVTTPDLINGRYFIWADAPRGSQVIVERWQPYIPIIIPNRDYVATINGNSMTNTLTDLPFLPSYQFYRLNIDITQPSFLLRVALFDLSQGSASLTISTGYSPTWFNLIGSCNADPTTDCMLEFSSCDLEAYAWNEVDELDVLFITIQGGTQTCELHSIVYTLNAQVTPTFDSFVANSQRCDKVEANDYHFYNLVPQNSGISQSSILSFNLYEVSPGYSVDLFVNDGHVASETCNTDTCRSGLSMQDGCQIDYICGYNSLKFSVYGIGQSWSDNEQINYGLNITRVPVNVTTLENGIEYIVDDTVDAACPHPYDFYLFRTQAVDPKTSFLTVVVESDFAYEVYVNKRSFGWSNCYDTGACNNPSGGTCIIPDACNFENTDYYITVSSQGPYTITASVTNNNQNLTLNSPLDDSVPQYFARTYTLFVNESLIQADTRLVVTIDNVNYGNLFAGIRYGALPGYDNDNYNLDSCALTTATIFMDAGVSNTGYLIVNHCDLVGGLWYIAVQGPNPVLNPQQFPYFRACHDIEYTITAQLVNLGIPITEITPSQSFDELTITYYGINRFPDGHAVYNFYSFPATLDVTTSFGQVRLANITNGYLSLRVKVGHLATDLFALYNGTRTGVLPLSTFDQVQSGSRPCTDQQILDPYDNCGNDICLFTPGQGCSDAFCSTSPYTIGIGSPETQTETSCAVYVPECTWAVGNVYIVVQALDQFDQTIPITYSLLAEEYSEALLLTPNEFVAAQATDNNWEYQFYQIQQPTVSSARVRVQIASGNGVWVTLTDAPCSENVTYTQSLWCHAHTPNVPFECDINIPTRASHPGVGHTNFYIAVYGGNATYAITYYEGRENCHQFQGLGVDDGLKFCAGLVPYSTWRWTNYTNLDNEASCLFEELYGNFRVQPCWSGVTGECNLTLQRFACFESFHRCDQDGFAVGTCRGACEAVVYECVNWFESVDLEHYNCTSSRYIDESFGACTGRLQQDLRQGDPADIDDPYYILYEASNNSANLGSSLSVLLMIVLATLAQLYFAAL